MTSILQHLLESNSISPKKLAKLESQVVHQHIPKGTLLQQKGDLSLKAYFVKKGLLRSYTIDEKGKEHVFMFAPEDWIMADLESRVRDEPTHLYIDALEDTDAEVVSWDMESIFRDIPADMLGNEMRKMLRRIAVLQRRVIMLMSAPAKERYLEFLKTYPDIVQRVPQRMIASYLGITPEALSKIKGGIARS